MALTHHCCLGPAANDLAVYEFGVGVTLERTGVSAGNACWAKYVDRAVLSLYTVDALDVAVPSSGANFAWDLFYFYGRAVPSGSGTPNSTYKGVWMVDLTYVGPNVGDSGSATVELREINASGTHKFELVEVDIFTPLFQAPTTTITSLGVSGAFADSVVRTIAIRMDLAAEKVYIYVDGTLIITGTLVLTGHGTPDGLTWFANGGVFRVPTSTDAVEGYWSSWTRYSSTVAADMSETIWFPEVHGHAPNAQGNYDTWNDVGGHTKYIEWADLVNDGLNDGGTTFLWMNNPTGKQSSKIESRVYTNAIKGATILVYERLSSIAKNGPLSALMRYSGSDKEVPLPNAISTSFSLFSAGYSSMPGGAAWSHLGDAAPNNIEIGADRTAAGDNVNNEVTAIWIEGAALGTTKKAPPNPPSTATGQPQARRYARSPYGVRQIPGQSLVGVA